MRSHALLVLGLALNAGIASAQPAPAPQTPAQRKGRALLQGGAKLLKQGQFAEALELLREAHATFPNPLILINIAIAEVGLGHPAAAANTYQEFLDAADRDPRQVSAVEADLATLDREVGRLRIVIEPASASAEFQVEDGPWRQVTTTVVRVEPGRRIVRGRTATGKTVGVDVDAVAGAIGEVTLRFVVVTPTPVPSEPTSLPKPVAARVAPPPTIARSAGDPSAFGAQLQLMVEPTGGGAAGALAATYSASARLKLWAGGIVGPTVGGVAGATLALTQGRLRPTVTGGLPVMVDDGFHVGVRGGAGLEWRVTRRTSVVADLNAEYYFDPGKFDLPFMVIPSFGVSGRL